MRSDVLDDMRSARIPPVMLALSKISWIPNFILISIILALALFPPILVMRWVFTIYDGLTPHWALDIFLLCFMFALSYCLFGICLMLASASFKRFLDLFGGVKEGEYPYYSIFAGHWSLVNGVILLNRIFISEVTRTTFLLVTFYRMMGMTVGKRAIINSTYIYDPDLVELGDNVTIGGDAVIMAHIGEKGVLKLKRTVIGNGVDIGQSAVIMQGVRIGDYAQVGALSLVTKETVIGPYEVWGGVPARKIGTSRRGH